MLIRELGKNECLRVLAGARFARLACARENQPYVVPVYLSYYEATGCLYGFTTRGQKIERMQANPLVCVEADEMTAQMGHERHRDLMVKSRKSFLQETHAGYSEQYHVFLEVRADNQGRSICIEVMPFPVREATDLT